MIASLPMYDRPETAAANDRLWEAIRFHLERRGIGAPEKLTRKGDVWEHWLSPDLVLSQTCGLPYRSKLHGEVTLLGAPVHDLNCAAAHYFSVVVVRKDETRDFAEFARATLAVNDALSQSGWAAPCALAEEHGFSFEHKLLTGGHQASSKAVADGKADLAALDAVTWNLIQRYDPWARELKVLLRTPPTPALPYIAAQGMNAEVLSVALTEAIAEMSASDKDVLCLQGFQSIAAEDYLAIPNPPPI